MILYTLSSQGCRPLDVKSPHLLSIEKRKWNYVLTFEMVGEIFTRNNCHLEIG